jgi:hypothetical protein
MSDEKRGDSLETQAEEASTDANVTVDEPTAPALDTSPDPSTEWEKAADSQDDSKEDDSKEDDSKDGDSESSESGGDDSGSEEDSADGSPDEDESDQS